MKLTKNLNFIDPNYDFDINFGHKKTQALILPHAGTKYVAQIFSMAFHKISGDYSRIIVLSTNHKNNKNIQPATPSLIYEEFTLPIKHVEYAERDDISFHDEHSYVSLLPYLVQFPSVSSIMIICVGSYNENLANELRSYLGEKTLLIANTDLLHCGERFGVSCKRFPPRETNIKIIREIINNEIFDNNKVQHICGRPAIYTFCKLIAPVKPPYVFYSSSDMIEKTTGSSVGYMGAVYLSTNMNIGYTCDFLATIPPDTLNKKRNLTLVFLKNITGAFVTIKKDNQLRGCIGTFKSEEDIATTIVNMTKSAAFRDSRFSPVIESEIPYLSFSITLLEKPFEIKNQSELIDAFIPGEHGISIFSNNSNATYIASVMVESFGANKSNKQDVLYKVIESLRKKGNIVGDIIKYELYRCVEIK